MIKLQMCVSFKIVIIIVILFTNMSIGVSAEPAEKNSDLLAVHIVKYNIQVDDEKPKKVYPEVAYAGKIVIDENLKIQLLPFKYEINKSIMKIYKNGKNRGFVMEKKYKNKPVNYPKSGKLYELESGWIWKGKIKKNDEYFIQAFLDVLYEHGYLELEYSAGEKIYRKNINDSNKYELLNATNLQKGDSIYILDKKNDKYIPAKHEPCSGNGT